MSCRKKKISRVPLGSDDFFYPNDVARNGEDFRLRMNEIDCLKSGFAMSKLCGLEAVRALLNGTDKEAVWSVNTEEEYHESSKENVRTNRVATKLQNFN